MFEVLLLLCLVVMDPSAYQVAHQILLKNLLLLHQTDGWKLPDLQAQHQLFQSCLITKTGQYA
jgi:hypothetical protein